MAAMSLVVSAGGHPFYLQAGKGFSISKPKGYKICPRAAVVEATPRVNGSPSSTSIQVLATDRAEELKAEARALARAADASVYSPQLLAKKYGSRPVKAVKRTLEILVALGTFALKLFLDQKNGTLDQNKRKRAAELRTIFTRLGPTFIKLGQGLSTRPDLCPPEYLEELAQLQVFLYFMAL